MSGVAVEALPHVLQRDGEGVRDRVRRQLLVHEDHHGCRLVAPAHARERVAVEFLDLQFARGLVAHAGADLLVQRVEDVADVAAVDVHVVSLLFRGLPAQVPAPPAAAGTAPRCPRSSGWQPRQKFVSRLPDVRPRTSRPQRGHGSPARRWTQRCARHSSLRCFRPSRTCLLQDGARPIEDGVHRTVQRPAVTVAQRRPSAVRVQARLPEDLVRVGVADAGDERLVGERVLELSAALAQPLGELILVDRECVRAELGELRDAPEIGALHEVEAAHAALVRVAQLVAVLEGERDRGRRAARLGRLGPVEAAGEHRVDDQHAAVVRGEEQELAMAQHVAEAVAAQRLQLLGSRAHEPGRPRFGAAHGVVAQHRREEAANHLKVRDLRHRARSSAGRSRGSQSCQP